MEGREKIKQLLKDGKINSDQAVLLLRALKESEDRRERIFKQVLSQREKREKDRWGFLGMWSLLVFVSILIVVSMGISQGIGQDVHKAFVHFNQASISLEKEDYLEAIKLIKKGIGKSPRFPLGYTLLGSTYRLLYKETKDVSIKEEEVKAFQKAVALKGDFMERRKMKGVAIFFVCVLLLMIAGIVSVIFLLLYNHLVKNEEKANEAWAQLKTFYDKKADLIPALLEVIKNYAKYEKETLESVSLARSDASRAMEAINFESLKEAQLKKVSGTQETLKGILGKLYALAENYPDLKANVNFLTIQQQLEETEDEIARAREDYNKKVRSYNSNIRYFPSNLIAATFGFDSKGYFEGQIT